MRIALIACALGLSGCAAPRSTRADLGLPADLLQATAPADLARVVVVDLGGADLACAPESDGAFCARLAKNCESVTAPDNCGATRSVDCGLCNGGMACVANVCRAPVCGTSFAATGTDLANVNAVNIQDALLGVSSAGTSILYLQATASCVGAGARLLIGDDASGSLSFTSQDVSALANLAGFAKSEETMTLSGDGLTIVGVTTTQLFAATTRSAAGKTDFAAPSRALFDTLNVSLPAGATLSWPLVSADLLAFYFRVDNATNASADGIYESVRASKSVPFPVAQKMPAPAQTFQAISGLSSDRMTAFMATGSYGTAILTRTSVLQPFTAPATSSPPMAAWRIVPLASCGTLIGTYEPGGCNKETIRSWLAN